MSCQDRASGTPPAAEHRKRPHSSTCGGVPDDPVRGRGKAGTDGGERGTRLPAAGPGASGRVSFRISARQTGHSPRTGFGVRIEQESCSLMPWMDMTRPMARLPGGSRLGRRPETGGPAGILAADARATGRKGAGFRRNICGKRRGILSGLRGRSLRVAWGLYREGSCTGSFPDRREKWANAPAPRKSASAVATRISQRTTAELPNP